MFKPKFSRRAFCMTVAAATIFSTALQAESLQKHSHLYRTDLGSASPALDVYTAGSLTNAPVMIFIHGGGWTIGKRSSVNFKPAHFVGQGLVFVSLDYRLFPTVTVAEQLGDIDAALGWISENITRHGGDNANLHLMGHSAGAHLVSMTAIAPQTVASRLISNGGLRSVVANDTRAYDLPRIATEARGGRMPRLYANVFGKDPDVWREFSPIYRIKPGQRLPNFLVLYSGQGGGNTRRGFAHDFATQLRRTSAKVTVFDGSEYSHLEINRGVGKIHDITAAIDGFLGENT